MPQSVQIAALGTANTPEDYTIPNSLEFVPLAVRASFDGTGASGPFYATLEFIGPGGLISAECPCFTTIAAGGSADVTWFHLDQGTDVGPTQSPYEQLVLSNAHLRAYYKLDETAGTVMQDSGPLGIAGTYQASPTLGQPKLADGFSVLWNRASLTYGKVLGSGGIVGTGEMSVVAWIKTSTAPGANPLQIVNCDDNNFRYFQFRIETTGKLGLINFDAPASPTAYQIVSPAVVNEGAKHMVAGTLTTAGTQTLYVDGVQVAQNVAALPTLSTRNLNMEIAGRLVGGPPVVNSFDGTMDEVSIYNFDLAAADILALYNAGV